jgi:hypothetical protein
MQASIIKSRLPQANSDQPALNQVIARSSAILLSDRIAWTYGLHGLGDWKPGIKPRSPEGIAVHHANWTKGVENKILLLRAVVAEQMSYTKSGVGSAEQPRSGDQDQRGKWSFGRILRRVAEKRNRIS